MIVQMLVGGSPEVAQLLTAPSCLELQQFVQVGSRPTMGEVLHFSGVIAFVHHATSALPLGQGISSPVVKLMEIKMPQHSCPSMVGGTETLISAVQVTFKHCTQCPNNLWNSPCGIVFKTN